MGIVVRDLISDIYIIQMGTTSGPDDVETDRALTLISSYNFHDIADSGYIYQILNI
jgi:hypothetical protein